MSYVLDTEDVMYRFQRSSSGSSGTTTAAAATATTEATGSAADSARATEVRLPKWQAWLKRRCEEMGHEPAEGVDAPAAAEPAAPAEVAVGAA